MRTARAAALVLMALAATGTAAGQDSPLSIHGLGIPGRFESVRARATGGAFAAFDQLSALTEAPTAGLTRLTATAAGAHTVLHDDFGGVTGSRQGRREIRDRRQWWVIVSPHHMHWLRVTNKQR